MTNVNHNNLLLEIILSALKGYALESLPDDNNMNGDDDIDVGKFSYLLGQSIRHWIVPSDNWHISEAALRVWNEITGNSPILHYRYKEPIFSQKSIIIPRFKGNTKDFAKLEEIAIKAEKKYVFNDVFIAEHTIPIADIMDALVECYNICSPIELKDKVVNILNSMHITQMLRIEDRRIVDYQRRIPILIRDENFNGNVYQYIEANNNVFVEVVDKCYTDLSSQEVKHSCSLKKYKHKLTTIKKMYGGSLPDWAKAIDLDESYSINIA